MERDKLVGSRHGMNFVVYCSRIIGNGCLRRGRCFTTAGGVIVNTNRKMERDNLVGSRHRDEQLSCRGHRSIGNGCLRRRLFHDSGLSCLSLLWALQCPLTFGKRCYDVWQCSRCSDPSVCFGVLLSGAGSLPVSASSSFPNGTYTLSGFGSGAYTVTPSKTGGVNGSDKLV